MTQLFVPPITDYKVLIPKTFITGGVTSKAINLTSFSFKALRLVAGLRSSSSLTAATLLTFGLYQVPLFLITGTIYRITNYAAPAQALVSFQSNNPTVGLACGTDAPAGQLTQFVLNVYNCQGTDVQPIDFYSLTPFFNNANHQIRWGQGQRDPAVVTDGLYIDLNGNTIDAISWYEVFKLE